MRFGLLVVLTVALTGCAPDRATPISPSVPGPVVPVPPTSIDPPAPPPPLTRVYFTVLEAGTDFKAGYSNEECAQNVTIEIVAGPGLGRRVQQKNGCTIYDPDFGARFDNVALGVEFTVRASASGYVPTEKSVIPTTDSCLA